MKSFSKRVASFTMAAAMVLSLAAVPTTDAEAASYSLTKKTSITSSTTGKYYIKGVSKKQYVKVSVSGAAKSGVTVKTSAGKKLTSSTKLNGTGKTLTLKVTNKGVVGKSYKLTAKVYNSNNKVAKTLTSTTYVKNNNFTLNTTAVSVVEDETATVKATAKYDYTTAGYTWTSADSNIATVSDGVITGVNAGSTNVTVKRGNYTKTVSVVVTAGPTKVTAATATNSTTVEMTGKHLERLTVKDVKVAGYTVETIKAAEDGKTAVVTLGSALIPNKEETVEVTINGEAAKFTVKYSTEASAVAVKDATYGVAATDTLTVLVNGVARTLDELKANGYATTFYSYEEDASGTLQTTTAANKLLDGASNFESTNGKLVNANKKPGVYKVKVVLVKGGTTLTSEYATITITDKLIYEQEIAEMKLVSSDSNYTYKLSGDAFAIKVGEKFELKDLKTKTTYGTDESLTAAQLAKVLVKSSDTSIATVSVAAGTTSIVAHKSGTTDITVTYGSLTKTFALTVKTDGRNFTSVEVPAPGEVVIGNTVSGKVFAKDNYGAYMKGVYVYVELPQNDTAVDADGFALNAGVKDHAPKSALTDADGAVTIGYKASTVAGAKATFSIYKGKATAPLYEGALLATYNMTNTAMNASAYKLEVVKGVGFSADTNVDFNPLAADDKVKIELKKFYNNVFDSVVTDLANSAVKTAKISYDDSVLCVEATDGTVIANGSLVSAMPAGINALVVYPTGKAGSATITLKDVTQNVLASISFTTTNTVPGVSDVKLAFNSINYDVNTTIDYRNVLSVVPNKNNPEVPDVTLTNNTKNYSVVKLCTVAGPTGYQYASAGDKRWYANVAIPVGSLYIEAPEGNLILGTLGFNKTVGGNNAYTAVTNGLLINANQATSINFAMLQSDDATAIMNVLASSIAVNSYK